MAIPVPQFMINVVEEIQFVLVAFDIAGQFVACPMPQIMVNRAGDPDCAERCGADHQSFFHDKVQQRFVKQNIKVSPRTNFNSVSWSRSWRPSSR